MPTYNLVDRFVASVTASFAGAAPLTASNIPLSVVTGLPTGGTAILTILRTVPGRAPTFVDEISDWTGIAGQTLTGAVRRDGAAIVAGDIVVCSWCQRYWAAAAAGTGWDWIVTTIGELNAAFAEANAGDRIWVQGGTYTLTGNVLVPSDVLIEWGGHNTGPVTLASGANDYRLYSARQGVSPGGAQTGEWFNYEFHEGLSFGVGGAAANQITLAGGFGLGTMPTMADVADWKVYFEGQEFGVTTRNATDLRLSSSPVYNALAMNNLNMFSVVYRPRRNVTMRGHLITTGSGAYDSISLGGYKWDTSGLLLECQMRHVEPALSSNVFAKFVRSTVGPISVSGFSGTNTTVGPIYPTVINCADSQASTFALCHVTDLKMQAIADATIYWYAVSHARTWACEAAVQIARMNLVTGGGAGTRQIRAYNMANAHKINPKGAVMLGELISPTGAAATDTSAWVDSGVGLLRVTT